MASRAPFLAVTRIGYYLLKLSPNHGAKSKVESVERPWMREECRYLDMLSDTMHGGAAQRPFASLRVTRAVLPRLTDHYALSVHQKIGEFMATIGVFAAVFDELGRILCVKRDYGPRTWTLPGGGMEAGESPIEALKREVREETAYEVDVGRLIGIYSAPFKDDLVLFFEATIVGGEEWQPDGEIAERGFYAHDEMPSPMGVRAQTRIRDAFDGRRGVVRVFDRDFLKGCLESGLVGDLPRKSPTNPTSADSR